jgi:hypothetical protein
MALFLVAFLLVALSAFFLTAVLRPSRRLTGLLAFFLFFSAILVLTAEIASLLQQFNPLFFLSAHSLTCLAAGLAWIKLVGGERFKLDLRAFQAPLRKHPEVLLLFLGVLLAYGAGLVLLLTTPQNNYDSMTYHLARVGYWLQHGTLAPWVTPNPRQVTFPPNAEILIAWAALFTRGEQLSGMVQWLSAPVTMLAIFGLAQLLGAKRWQALFLSALWAILPENWLQSPTTMNDLISAAFLTSGVTLLYTGWQERGSKSLALAGLAFGLAAGTKSTVALALPGLALAALLLVFLPGRRPAQVDGGQSANPFASRLRPGLSRLGVILTSGLAAFILLGMFIYAQNQLAYGNPLSVPQWTGDLLKSDLSKTERLAKNLLLYTFQAADLTGLPPAIRQPLAEFEAGLVQEAVQRLPALQGARFGRWLTQLNRILYGPQTVHEDQAWFGPLFLLLFLPAALIQAIHGLRQRDPLRLGLLGLTFGFLLTQAYIQEWSPYKGRYFVLVVPLAMPLLLPWLELRGLPGRLTRWAIVLLSLLVISVTVLTNYMKPLSGSNAVWKLDDIRLRTINHPGFEPVLRAVEANVPAEANLATRFSEDTWDYPLFGERFSRRVIQLDPFAAELDFAPLLADGIEFFLFEPRERPFLATPAGLELIWQQDGWTLFRACLPAACRADPQAEQLLRSAVDSRNLVRIAPELVGKLGILGLVPTIEWPIEQIDGQGFYWIGEGTYQGLKGYLWSDQAREVSFSLLASPGPARADPNRTLILNLEWLEGYGSIPEGKVEISRSFSGPVRLVYRLKLQRGLNEFQLQSPDLANILEQPNGDRRPILIKIENLLVRPLGGGEP